MVLVVTVSDDRAGRKGGAYGVTQQHITDLFRKQPAFGVHEVRACTFEQIQDTPFYLEHKEQLDRTDADQNGRIYKPYVILEALRSVPDGAFVVYTDCSPELWRSVTEIDLAKFHISVGTQLCEANGGILNPFVGWPAADERDHTHENFTSLECLDAMDGWRFQHCLQGASGLFILQRTPRTLQFVQDWLRWSSDDRCCRVHGVSFAQSKKLGHRTDQSIAGLLLNKMGHALVKPADPDLALPYFNLLQYCKIGAPYTLVSTLQEPRSLEYKSVYNTTTRECILERTKRLPVLLRLSPLP